MEIRDRIIHEAGILFAKYGIRSITMDALAEDMGISKRTIYENFKDKDTLLIEVITFHKKKQLSDLQKIIKEKQNIVDAMFSLLHESINNMKQVNPMFFHDLKKYHPQIFSQLKEKGDIRDYSITMRILTEGKKQAVFRNDLNLELVNEALHELFKLFSPESKLTSEGYHRAELFNNIIIPFLRGISTEKGVMLIDKKELIKH
ncbi:MAG TPA: TetR/AcrR family transcriptional regulator [Bacteroidales bacterium]|nr:TetR/AcrR family transcriptional regulator [Bacteroidales bacterium]